MDLIFRLIIAVTFVLFAVNTQAGQDPISWSQSGSLPATAQLNHSYAIHFTLTNKLPFTLPTPLYLSNNSSSPSETVMVDHCSGLRLTRGQTCTVGLVLTPKSAGIKRLSIFMEYGSNKVKIPDPQLETQVPSSGSSQLVGIAIVGFPSAILSATTYPLSFQFTNTSSSTLSNLVLAQSAGNSAGYTQSSTTCASTLAAGASCAVTGSFITTATTGPVTVGLTLTSSTISGTATSSSIVSSTAAGVRTVTFVNNCSQTVWFGLVGGAVNTNPCKSNADCAHGSFCNPSANVGAGECFYTNPAPTNGVYQLAASGGTNTVLIPDYSLQYVWSGNMAARTGSSCATGTCDTADCASGGGNYACPIGRGFDQPATLAEFTLQRATIDSYDVSIINGMNVGVQITPTTTHTFTPNGIAAYNCTSPGNPNAVPALGLGACNWASGFIPPAFPDSTSPSSYIYVKPPTSGVTSCTDNTPCSVAPNTTCGLSFNKNTTTLSKVCGQFLGYLTANQACSFANTNLAPGKTNNPGDAYFPCDTAIAAMPSYTYWGLFACKAQANGDLGTCYNTSANPPASTANCCGCVNWQNVSGVTVPSTTTTCVNTNNSWTGVVPPGISPSVLPGLEWLKKACPTAYVYPFDDKAGGFGCNDISGSHTVNTVNYTITFCPS